MQGYNNQSKLGQFLSKLNRDWLCGQLGVGGGGVGGYIGIGRVWRFCLPWSVLK